MAIHGRYTNFIYSLILVWFCVFGFGSPIHDVNLPCICLKHFNWSLFKWMPAIKLTAINLKRERKKEKKIKHYYHSPANVIQNAFICFVLIINFITCRGHKMWIILIQVMPKVIQYAYKWTNDTVFVLFFFMTFNWQHLATKRITQWVHDHLKIHSHAQQPIVYALRIMCMCAGASVCVRMFSFICLKYCQCIGLYLDKIVFVILFTIWMLSVEKMCAIHWCPCVFVTAEKRKWWDVNNNIFIMMGKKQHSSQQRRNYKIL